MEEAADSSSHGLGTKLEQFHDGEWKPVMYSSRSLTQTETRYAQVEKEALALTWACEKFSRFLPGTRFILLTDHKALVVLLDKKPISDLSARLQRLRMCLLLFDFEIRHVPGKPFYIPDMLSKNSDNDTTENEHDIVEDELLIDIIIKALPCSDDKLSEIIREQTADRECQDYSRVFKEQYVGKRFSILEL